MVKTRGGWNLSSRAPCDESQCFLPEICPEADLCGRREYTGWTAGDTMTPAFFTGAESLDCREDTRERQRHREKYTETHRETHTERQTHRQRETHTEWVQGVKEERKMWSDKEREIWRPRRRGQEGEDWGEKDIWDAMRLCLKHSVTMPQRPCPHTLCCTHTHSCLLWHKTCSHYQLL